MSEDGFEHQSIKQLNAALDKIRTIDLASLVRKDELGQYSLHELEDYIPQIINLANRIETDAVNALPIDHRCAIERSVNRFFAEGIGKVKSFSLQQCGGSDIGGCKQNVYRQFKEPYNELWKLLVEVLPLNRGAGDKVNNAIHDMKASKDDLLAIRLGVDDKIENAIKMALAANGVMQNEKSFENEANKNNEMKINCLYASAVITIVMLLFCVYMMTDDVNHSYGFLVGRVGTLAVLGTLLMASIRAFLSYQHNETVNRHRQNCMNSFRIFAEASGDNKDAMVANVANQVFNPQTTGFTKGADGSSLISNVASMIAKIKCP